MGLMVLYSFVVDFVHAFGALPLFAFLAGWQVLAGL